MEPTTPRSSLRSCYVAPFVAGWSTVGIACFVLLFAMAAPEARSARTASDDLDGDFVIDALDNCLRHPNTLQRDSDRDGIGNACDPDFDQNGIVDKRDLALIRAFIALLGREPKFSGERFLRSRDFDSNGDGIVDRIDVKRVRSFLGQAPGPRQDSDGDGIADAEDPCGNTPRGFQQLLPGCAAIDIAQHPEFVLEPIAASLSGITESIRPEVELRQVAFSLDEAVAALEEGVVATRGGDPCSGQRFLGLVDGKFGLALREFGSVLVAARSAAVRAPKKGDIGPEEERGLALYETHGRHALDAHQWVGPVGTCLNWLAHAL